MDTSSSDDEAPGLALVMAPLDTVPTIWARFGVGDMFREHEAKAEGHWTADWLYSEIMGEGLQLWLVVDPDEKIRAALVTDITPYRNGFKTCLVTVIVGSEPRSWIKLRHVLEDWARDQGCVKIEAIGRVGWKRIIPDWKPTHIFFEKALA